LLRRFTDRSSLISRLVAARQLLDTEIDQVVEAVVIACIGGSARDPRGVDLASQQPAKPWIGIGHQRDKFRDGPLGRFRDALVSLAGIRKQFAQQRQALIGAGDRDSITRSLASSVRSVSRSGATPMSLIA
jgi:hypothetical protein